MKPEWFSTLLRRNLLDFHIDEWDAQFLSRFDPARFADAVERAGSGAATIFANSHTGLCHYPTRIGKMHSGLHGRDILGETADELHRRGIAVVIYYCTIYCDWYWEEHPQARIVDAAGASEKLLMNSRGKPRRFSVSCPNNDEYRDFVSGQLIEICTNYDFEGVWPDMTFWPCVCFCASCNERYEREAQRPIPRTIDWRDPEWVLFQRKREQWIRDFAHLVTSTIKREKPRATVAHQSWTFFGDWRFGASVELAEESDWLSADLYGDRYSLSFFAKLFYGLSRRLPFEHINTWCYPNIHEHVVPRTEQHLRLNAFSAVMNGGAMVFIDAIDPDGSVHERMYDVIGRAFADVRQYETHMGGKFCQDVAIYYSFESLIDLAQSEASVETTYCNFDPREPAPSDTVHRSAALSAAKSLVQAHVPYGVITRKDLDRLDEFRVILLPNVCMLSDIEADAFRTYVRAGGSLYASKYSSLIDPDGRRRADFALADLFGVHFRGETEEIVTYCAPVDSAEERFSPFDRRSPLTVYDTQLRVAAEPNTQVMAYVTLPYSDPRGTKYASILTDPPGRPTEHPAVVLSRHGNGTVIYAAGTLECGDHESQRNVFLGLLQELAAHSYTVQTSAHKSVELTLFHQPERNRYILCAINYQQELPNIPHRDITVRLEIGGATAADVRLLPSGEGLSFEQDASGVRLVLPLLVDFAMAEVALR